MYCHMKLNPTTNLYEVRCKCCRKTTEYASLKYAKANFPHCIRCRNGKVIYYDKSKEMFYTICKSCGSKRYSNTENECAAKLSNKSLVGCNSCKGPRIRAARIIYDSQFLFDHGILRHQDGKYDTVCPNGHRKTVKTIQYAVGVNSGKYTCVECSRLKQKAKFKKTFKKLPNEQWQTIPTFEHYEVSTTGRVVNTNTGRTLKPQTVSQMKYYAVCLFKSGRCKWFYVHRLVAKAFIPNPQKLGEVDHLDHNHFNNDVSNLRWITHGANIQAAHDAGRYPYNSLTNNKLTEANVREIRKYPKRNYKHWMKKFGVRAMCVYNVKNNKTWRNV